MMGVCSFTVSVFALVYLMSTVTLAVAFELWKINRILSLQIRPRSVKFIDLYDEKTGLDFWSHYCKTVFIREDFVFAWIREGTEMWK